MRIAPRRPAVVFLLLFAAGIGAPLALWVQVAPASVARQHDSVASFTQILSHDFEDGEEQVGVVRFQRITPSLTDVSKEWISLRGHVRLEAGAWCLRTAVTPSDSARRQIRTRLVTLSRPGTITLPAITRQRAGRGKVLGYVRVWPERCGGQAFTRAQIVRGGE